MSAPIQLTLDPWASDHDGEIAIATAGDATTAPIDTAVETERWEARRPPPDPLGPAPLVFVDGVRRVEARILATTTTVGDQSYGLLGAHAVGALSAIPGATPELLAVTTARLLVLGDGREHAPLEVTIPEGNGTLTYDPYPVPEAEPEAPLHGLQTAMRKAEATLARGLAATGSRAPAGSLIVADGPLAYLERTPTPLIGFVKSLHRAYLGPSELPLLTALRTGERTPIFAILDQNRRYSWYLRLGSGGPAEHPLAGIARLECGSALGIEGARMIADRSAPVLVRSASTRERDPRSPQNLLPLGGLEAELRRRLGDRALARRAIIAHLAGESASPTARSATVTTAPRMTR
jgi:hypothetical protein